MRNGLRLSSRTALAAESLLLELHLRQLGLVRRFLPELSRLEEGQANPSFQLLSEFASSSGPPKKTQRSHRFLDRLRFTSSRSSLFSAYSFLNEDFWHFVECLKSHLHYKGFPASSQVVLESSRTSVPGGCVRHPEDASASEGEEPHLLVS